jgi:hypothetical protein
MERYRQAPLACITFGPSASKETPRWRPMEAAMSRVDWQSVRPSPFELARQWSTSSLIITLLFVARRWNAMAIAANRRGRHSGWIGSASRALTDVSTRLYEAESARRRGV